MHKIQSLMEEDALYLINKINYQNFFDGKKILITGASGLIGLNMLVFFDTLLKTGGQFQILAVINKSPVNLLKYYNFSDKITFKRCDLINEISLISENNFDIIIHAACYGQPGKFLENKIDTLKLNSSVLLELYSKLNNDGKFLFISSSEVYSGNENAPYLENQIGTTDPSHSRACYIEGKRFGETVTHIKRSEGILSYSARLSLSYGPGTRANDRRVINEFMRKGILDKQIALQDQGESLRTYCYVTDAIDILFRILIYGNRCIYNVGGKSTTSIKELAYLIGNNLEVPVYLPEKTVYLTDAPQNVALNLDLIEKDLFKNDFIDFNDGIYKTIEWQKEMYLLSV
ncbi:NAD-dependent epimerase/dehydratase family protein [Pigmentibacter ruber]